MTFLNYSHVKSANPPKLKYLGLNDKEVLHTVKLWDKFNTVLDKIIYIKHKRRMKINELVV